MNDSDIYQWVSSGDAHKQPVPWTEASWPEAGWGGGWEETEKRWRRMESRETLDHDFSKEEAKETG